MKNIICLLVTFTLISNCFTQVLTSGDYVITLAGGGKALDAAAESMGLDDGLIQLRENNSGSTQVWSVRPVSGNSYSVILKATEKALDADGPGMYTDGGKVHLWTKREDGFKTQNWTISFAGNNSYTVVLRDGSKALDAGISSMYQNGGIVHLWSENSGKTQQWVFTKAVPVTDG